MVAATPLDLDSVRLWRETAFYPKADLPLPDEVLRANRQPVALGYDVESIADGIRRAPLVAVEPLPSGTFHDLWRIRYTDGAPLVFRANALSEWIRDYPLLIDGAMTNRLRRAELPALDVHECDLTRKRVPFDYSILDEARGHSLRAFDADDAKLIPLLRRLARFLACVHRIEVDSAFGLIDVGALTTGRRLMGIHATWDDYLLLKLDEHVRICVDIEAITSVEGSQIHRRFEDSRGIFGGKGSLLHGDPGNHNVFVDNGRITALIDWEDAVVGDPVYEIAFWATFHPEHRHSAFIDAYREEADLPKDFDYRFWLYFLRVALAKTVLRHRLGLKDKPGREPAALRIRKSLQRLHAPQPLVARGANMGDSLPLAAVGRSQNT